MRRLGIWLLIAPLAIACGPGPRTETDAGPQPGDDGGPVVDPDSGTPGDPDGGPTCIDDDGDGYGEGCSLGADCNDADPAVSPAATETCNGVDDDCDGTTDEELVAPSCDRTEGVCAGAVARCDGAAGFVCDAAQYGDDYEADETLCDGLDNDCDGTTDEGCTCEDGDTQPCGSDVGACMPGTQTCSGGTWGACSGEVTPMGEVCDGLDNDCDGSVDDPADLTPPACPLQQGVCAGSTRACGGAAGWIACDGIASYGGDYQVSETLCDGLDNDCDGVADENCECVDGTTQPCGSDIGACMQGTQTCVAGVWGSCSGAVQPAAETCDGTDEDCDGTPDNGVVGPACALQDGVCSGSRQRCGGASGFVACTASDYGSDYESDETLCDGLDNDCDGDVDEGCGCAEGATQACGISTGVCERGTQTCSGGEWGACVDAVEPVAELCNGLDDDCNGASDDALTPPACALTLGVCAGKVQTCGGASGWMACDASTYGPSYLVAEDGASDPSACDGLDNDCDGDVDEGCASGALVNSPDDESAPDLHHRHLVYLRNYGGNNDVVFTNLETGETRRLTTTPENESGPRIYGNHVVFIRGEGAAARAVLYDLTDDTETVISTLETNSVEISRSNVLYDAWDGGSWELYVYNIATGAGGTLFTTPSTYNEILPSMRGNRLAYLSDESGTWLTTILDLSAGTVTTISPATPGEGHLAPMMDYVGLGWTDGRFITSPSTPEPNPADDWDVLGAFYLADGSLGAEGGIAQGDAGQWLAGVDSGVFVWNDARNGNWDVGVFDATGASGMEELLSTDLNVQVNPAVSGNLVVWQDNRAGGFDLWSQELPAATTPTADSLVITEILADPAVGADVNGDGAANASQDEFVEIVSVVGVPLDISGVTLSDATGVRHTFPAGTVLPALGTIVVFGGGTIGSTALFGGARAQIASSGQLGLNNDTDTITLSAGSTVITTVSYSGSVASGDQSIVPDPAGGTGWVRHSTVAGSIGAQSPGTDEQGFGF